MIQLLNIYKFDIPNTNKEAPQIFNFRIDHEEGDFAWAQNWAEVGIYR